MRSCLTAFACLAFACGPPDTGPDATVTTLPNGARQVRNEPTSGWSGDEGWRLEPELRIGSVDGAGAAGLGSVLSLAVDAGGRIWVLEGQALDVRVFAAEGGHVRTFGRRGGGPGEFARPGGLVFGPDGGLWIPDAGNRRYAEWDTSGVEVGNVAMDTKAARFRFDGGMTADGTLWDVDLAAGGGEAPVSPLLAAAGLGGGGEVLRPVLRADGGPVASDTLPIPALDGAPEVWSAGRMMLGVPFMPRMHWLFDPAGALWSGSSGEYRVQRQTLSGDTTLVIERAYEPLPVTSGDVETWLAGRGPRTLIEAGGTIDRSRIPSVHPVFDDLMVDDTGHLWVRLVTGGEDVAYDVFDAEGFHLGAVRTEERISRFPRPVVIGNRFYGVVRDELDVPYVVRFRIAGR